MIETKCKLDFVNIILKLFKWSGNLNDFPYQSSRAISPFIKLSYGNMIANFIAEQRVELYRYLYVIVRCVTNYQR